MKKSNKLIAVILLFACTFIPNYSVGQFALIGAGNNSGHTLPSVETVGIGNNTSYNNIRAILYVNSNLVWPSSATPVVNPGDVFGTDCPTGTSALDICAWRMHRNGTEVFNINNPYNSNSVSLGTVQSGNIYIYTNGSANIRQTILSNYNVSGGLVGIGDMNPGGTLFTPRNLLHLHRDDDATSVYEQFTNGHTLGTATDGFLVGMRHDGTSNVDIAELRYQENAPLSVWTGDNSPITGSVNQRMYVTHDNMASFAFTDLTRIGVVENGPGFGPGILPRSLLHLGFPDALTNGGYRAWMDIGTFNHGISDEAYFGLKLEPWSNLLWTDNMDAVIGWGDNIETPEGADNLRFIFTAIQTTASATAGQFDGLEVARFTPTGRFGLGNFTQLGAGAGSGVQPARRLEVYGENLDAYLHAAAPQLRLTFTPATVANPATTGVWIDFQTMDVGDLFIHSYGLTAAGGTTVTDRRVGINISTPLAVLNVDGRYVNTALNPGDVFRTDGPSNSTQTWTMFKNNVEYGRLFNPAFANNFTIQATQRHLNFNSGNNGTVLEAMRIVGANSANKRFVGIGDYSSANFNEAQNQLHQWITGTANVYHQFSNDNTTATDGNQGFKLGITYNGTFSDAELISQQNGADINFYTTAAGGVAQRMQVASGGNIGIGALAQTGDKLYVRNDYSLSNAPIGIETYTYASANSNIVGIYSKAYNGATNNWGGYFYSLGTTNTTSGIGAYCISEYCHDFNFGVRTFGRGGLEAYGSWMTAESGTNSNIGIVAEGVGVASGSTINVGVSAAATYGAEAYGVKATAAGATSVNYGINAAAGTSLTFFANSNIGGNFKATSGSTFTYGVYASSTGGACTATSTTSCITVAGFFEGNVCVTNTFQNSDLKLKTNIASVTNAMGIINQFQPKTYHFDTIQFSFMSLPGEQQFGLIAQDLLQVLPQCVKEFGRPTEIDSTGNIVQTEVDFLAVNYVMLIPILIAGMKEQQQQINDLQAQLINCCGVPKMGNNETREKTGTIEVKLNDRPAVILNQNEPNPFKENTTITYNIPDDMHSAQMLIYNNKGNVISTVEIKEIGPGSLLVYGSDLNSGIYTYTLMVNGKPVETKKMMKVK